MTGIGRGVRGEADPQTPAAPIPAFLDSTVVFTLLASVAMHVNGAYRTRVLPSAAPCRSE